MKFYQKLDGAVHISAREYDIAADTAITEGQVVKLTEGLVVAAAQDETGSVLGIAAETHSGTADALDPRADGTKIMVIDDPDVILQCAAPQVTAAGGSTTTLEVGALKAFDADDFNGGYVKLVSKAEGSTNADAVGAVRRITDFAADSEAGILTIEEGGAPYAGDVYAVFPPIGFAKGNLSADGCVFTLDGSAALPLKVAGHDRAFGKINLIVCKHVFAVN